MKALTKKEYLFVILISVVLGIRQMAMTLVMPFISTYSSTLRHNTPLLAGAALGVFGLTQAIFQIPYGMLSDRIGNKIVMLIGLVQVFIGLIIAYIAKDIYILILARALQGSGAIVGVGYSWIGGSVTNEKRTQALSILGMIIGVAAVLSFGIGPIIHGFISLKQMFLICALLILTCFIYISFFIKDTKEAPVHPKNNAALELIKNKPFIKLNLAAFLNNFIMVSVFYFIPIYLNKLTGANGMWKVFLPAVIIAVICMKISVKYVDRGHSEPILLLSFVSTFIGICFYFTKSSFIFITIGTILFMIGYICLSTILCSNANNIASEENRGTANGIINSFQYIGSFAGSIITGILWGISEYITIVAILIVSLLGIFTIYSCKNYFKNEEALRN